MERYETVTYVKDSILLFNMYMRIIAIAMLEAGFDPMNSLKE